MHLKLGDQALVLTMLLLFKKLGPPPFDARLLFLSGPGPHSLTVGAQHSAQHERLALPWFSACQKQPSF